MAVTFSTSTGAAGGVQSAYANELTAALEGQFADIADNNVSTFVNETSAVLAYGGLGVVNGSGSVGNSVKTIAAATDTVVGVVALTYVDESASDSNSRPGVKDDQAVNVLSKGVVAVFCVEAVDLTSEVRVYHDADTGTTSGSFAGRFAATAAANKTAVLSGARWVSKTSAAGIALLELNGPDFSLTADT
ncbi:MAG: hypothetical protein CMK37_07850 [Porticoccaceae bacterium]|nr:hypothetical protein [Porticoccaceae bacterium]|tara:strand:+ start:1757 stop:2326 length:570 start_codon:yes stop_codon:yes gene_type:complete